MTCPYDQRRLGEPRSEFYSKLFEAFTRFWVLSRSTSFYYPALAVSGILPVEVQIDALNLAP
jgi:hypothetical protein